MATIEQYNDTIRRCVRHNLPFTLYMAPDTDDVIFFSQRPDENNECRAELSDPTWNGFFINFFNNDEPYIAGVAYDYDIDETIAELDYLENVEGLYMPADVVPSLKSTTRLQHAAAVRVATDAVRHAGGKAVVSQMTAVATRKPLHEVMWDYFHKFRSTFRFLVFTPETGLWLGATPELLVRCFPRDKAVLSMALAGTMPAEDNSEWSDKNIREHLCVVNHIVNTFESAGLAVELSNPEELYFGPVKHLCTHVAAEGDFDPAPLLYALSPTPAVAGYPDRDKAVELISRIEKHQRYCYTGFVGIKSGDDIEAYVNLRSALIVPCLIDGEDAYVYNIYSGGGIMPDSRADEEWDEVMAKMSPLYSLVTGDPSTPRPDEIKENITFPDYASRRDFLMMNRYVK
ncbi:MAG: chorismate-binding protein [Duncaniella sp.]|nr:chorismate-binding protein [Duncaniella sp.]